MALFTRISRLFRADINEVLDRIEEPDVLLKQAVRDMEEEVGTDERRNKELARELRQVDSRNEELEHSLSEIEDELDLCFASGKDDIARALVKRKLESQRYVQFLQRKRKSLVQDEAALEKRIGDNRSRLESMRQKAEILAERDAGRVPDEDPAGIRFETRFAASREDVEVALLREKRKRAQS